MAQNFIQIFDDTVLKLTINQGLESQRTETSTGQFVSGELAFTRDSGRVFVGDFRQNVEGSQETIGGTLVGNKYLGSIDSKTIELYNSDPSKLIKPLDYENDTRKTQNSGTAIDEAYHLSSTERGLIGKKSKNKENTLFFKEDQPFSEQNWNRWNRSSYYNYDYDAFDGDIIYDKFQNALVLFDHTIKNDNEQTINEKVIPGWMHSVYGPSYQLYKSKSDTPKYYLYVVESTDGNLYGADHTGESTGDQVDTEKVYGFWNGESDPWDQDIYEGQWVIVECGSNGIPIGMEENEVSRSPIYVRMISGSPIPYYDQSQSKNRTIFHNRLTSDSESGVGDDQGSKVYGNGYVMFRNIEPDNVTLQFAPRVGLQVEPKAKQTSAGIKYYPSFKGYGNDVLSSNVLQVKGITPEGLTYMFDENYFTTKNKVSLNTDGNFDIKYLTANELLLPQLLKFGSKNVSNQLNFSLNETTNTPAYVLVVNGSNEVLKASSLTTHIHLGDGLMNGKDGSSTLAIDPLYDDPNTTLELNLSSVSASNGDRYQLPIDNDDTYNYDDDNLKYVSNLVINSLGNVIDSDKYYKDHNIQIGLKYEGTNHPYNLLKNPLSLAWGEGDFAASFSADGYVYELYKSGSSSIKCLHSNKSGSEEKVRRILRYQLTDSEASQDTLSIISLAIDSEERRQNLFLKLRKENGVYSVINNKGVKINNVNAPNDTLTIQFYQNQTSSKVPYSVQIQSDETEADITCFDIFNKFKNSDLIKYVDIPLIDGTVETMSLFKRTDENYGNENPLMEYTTDLETIVVKFKNSETMTLKDFFDDTSSSRNFEVYDIQNIAGNQATLIGKSSVNPTLSALKSATERSNPVLVVPKYNDEKGRGTTLMIYNTNTKGLIRREIQISGSEIPDDVVQLPINARSVILQVFSPGFESTSTKELIISTKDIAKTSSPSPLNRLEYTVSGGYPTPSSEVAGEKILITSNTRGSQVVEVPIHRYSIDGSYYFTVIGRNLQAGTVVNMIGYRA